MSWMATINEYRIVIEYLSHEDGNRFFATVPELPGCMSDGDTPEEAVTNVRDAIICWIEQARTMGRPIPQPKWISFSNGLRSI